MTRKSLFSAIGHAAVIATMAGVTLTAVVPAVAETGAVGNGSRGVTARRDATDLSARRKVHHGGRGAAVGAFDAMGGARPAIAPSRNRGAYTDGQWECSPLHCGPRYYRGDRDDGGESSGGSSTPAVAW